MGRDFKMGICKPTSRSARMDCGMSLARLEIGDWNVARPRRTMRKMLKKPHAVHPPKTAIMRKKVIFFGKSQHVFNSKFQTSNFKFEI